VPGRERGREELCVPLLAGGGGLGGPDSVQDGQVVGIGQCTLPGLGRRLLLAVSVQDLGEHPKRILGIISRGGRARVAGLVREPVVAG